MNDDITPEKLVELEKHARMNFGPLMECSVYIPTLLALIARIRQLEATAAPSPEREGLANELIAWAASDTCLELKEHCDWQCNMCGATENETAEAPKTMKHKPDCFHIRAQAATRPEDEQLSELDRIRRDKASYDKKVKESEK